MKIRIKQTITGLQTSVLVLVTIVFLSSCGKNDARVLWARGIKKCANSDILSQKMLYFGPSFNLVPGTIFERFESDGAYQQSNLVESFGGTNPPSWLQVGQEFGPCNTESNKGFDLSVKAPLASVLPIGGDAALQLKRASKVTVTAERIRVDSIVTDPYRSAILGLDESHTARTALTQRGHFVLSRAIMVKGMKVTAQFSSNIGPSVKANLPEGIVPSGETGVNVTATWTGETKLELTATNDFYIAGKLRRWRVGGLAGQDIGPEVDAGKGVYRPRN